MKKLSDRDEALLSDRGEYPDDEPGGAGRGVREEKPEHAARWEQLVAAGTTLRVELGGTSAGIKMIAYVSPRELLTQADHSGQRRGLCTLRCGVSDVGSAKLIADLYSRGDLSNRRGDILTNADLVKRATFENVFIAEGMGFGRDDRVSGGESQLVLVDVRLDIAKHCTDEQLRKAADEAAEVLKRFECS